jgi:hypothetical protein
LASDKRLQNGAADSSPPQVGARKADRDPLLPGDFEFDGRPIADWMQPVDAPASDSIARLKIGLLVKSVDEAARVREDCRFPFCPAPDASKKHG